MRTCVGSGPPSSGGKPIRLRRFARLNPGRAEVAHLPSDFEVTFLPMERVSELGEVDYSVTRSLGEVRSGYTYFRDGDVVVAKITPCFENGKSARILGCTNGIGFGTTEFHVIRVEPEVTARYLSYVVRSSEFLGRGAAAMSGAAGQQRVPEDFVLDFPVPIPPLPVQRAIADFLDRKTAALDGLIARKERLLELLAERRAALIHRAVTRGLDPDVPMKDSGVPWIGEIPAHWEVKRLKHECRLANNLRVPLSSEERGRRQGPFPYYGASGIIDYVDDYVFDGTAVLIAEDGANLRLRNLPLAPRPMN